MANLSWLNETWETISSQLKVDKIYLETHRDLLEVNESVLTQAKRFFLERNVSVGGGITFTINESNSFETFCYSNETHRAYVQHLANHTATFFDDFILDDFFFTSCKQDVEIAAKGNRTWTEYRLDLMTNAGRDLVVIPAHLANNGTQVIIKFPNWYDDFTSLGFNLKDEPAIFDQLWTGTETRMPSSSQHLQNYLSYEIIRYFSNIAPGRNGGGWVDTWDMGSVGLDRYAEQLWLTIFARPPSINLFAYNLLLDVKIDPSIHRTPWQGQNTSFDYDEMMQGRDGVIPSTAAGAAGYVFDKINKFVSELGEPYGIPQYKPYNSDGEPFLPNYLGMIGLPIEMVPEFPENASVVILTEQAKDDPDIIDKIKKQLKGGRDVVITSGLVKAIPERIAEIVEVKSEFNMLVNDFGEFGKADKDILLPSIWFWTNDAWDIINAGRPLTKGTFGTTLLLRAPYSQGTLWVWSIPVDFGELYSLPAGVLNRLRRTFSTGMNIYLEGVSKISLFLYNNDTFIVENFNDFSVDTVAVFKYGSNITEITDVDVQPVIQIENLRAPINIKPHSFRVFKLQ